MPVVPVPVCPSGVRGIVAASGWSIGVRKPRFATKPWLVVPAAAGGASADAGAAPSTASDAAAATQEIRLFHPNEAIHYPIRGGGALWITAASACSEPLLEVGRDDPLVVDAGRRRR